MNTPLETALIKRLHYSSPCAVISAQQLDHLLDGKLREALTCWVQTGQETALSVPPCTTDALMQDHHMTYPAALLFLAWLQRDAATALSALRNRL